MKCLCVVLCAALLAWAAAVPTAAGQVGTARPAAPGRYEPTIESLSHKNPTPEWFKDSVLGIYFHWGIYTVPDMTLPPEETSKGHPEKYGSGMYSKPAEKSYLGWHIKKWGDPTKFGYKDFIPMFKAEKWDPEAWAELFKEAGADFAGPCAEHHDGFAMWDCSLDEFNSVKMGPNRDITGEMEKAIRKRGMRFLATFHDNVNWRFFDSGRRYCPPGVDVNDPKFAGLYGPVHNAGEPMSDEFKLLGQRKLIEFVDKFKPDIIWHEASYYTDYGDKIILPYLAHYFNASEKWGREVVVTFKRKELPLSFTVFDMENFHAVKAPKPQKWLTDYTMDDWSYMMVTETKTPAQIEEKTKTIIDGIIDRVSNNGVCLLDIGPRADGTIPESQIATLKNIGKWLRVNKPGLAGAVPSPFVKGGPQTTRNGSIVFMRKGPDLFAFDLEKPVMPTKIPGVTAVPDSKIRMLGSAKDLAWHQDGADVVIEILPDPLPCDYAWGFQIRVGQE